MVRARRSAIAVLLLLLVTLAGYLNSFPGAFIWDDVTEVVGNPLVSSLDLRAIFTTDYCGRAANCGTYRPLTVLSYALNHRLAGPDPAAYHAVNVALHALTTLLLFLLLETLGFGAGVAWLASALFGVHPIHTEVVNIVTYRSESLAALGVLLALWVAARRRRGHVALAVAAYACALLSKENGLVFLLLLPLVDAFGSGSLRQTIRDRLPLYTAALAVTAAWFAVRHLVARNAMVPPDLIYATDNPLVNLSLLPRLLTALKAQVLYGGQLLFPIRLQAVYTGNSVGVVTTPFSVWGLASLATTALALGLGFHGWRTKSAFGFGILFYAASFAITANILFTLPNLLAERLAYLPSAGFCLAVASLVPASTRPRARAAAKVLCCAYLLVLGGILVRRNRDFAGELPLALAAVRADPGNTRAWYYLGGAFEKGGNTARAEEALRTAISLDPGFPEPAVLLAQLMNWNGRHEEAADLARRALAAAPGESPQASMVLATASLELGDPAAARAWVERAAPALRLDETFWDLRARVMEAQGDLPGAVEARRRGYALNESPDAGLRLAELLLRTGADRDAGPILERAETRLREELRRSESAATLNLYGLIHALRGNYGLAVPAFRRAVELDPASPAYRGNLERALGAAAGR